MMYRLPKSDIMSLASFLLRVITPLAALLEEAVKDALFAAASILALLTELRLEDLELAVELALDFCTTFHVAREPTLLIESSGSRFDRLVALKFLYPILHHSFGIAGKKHRDFVVFK